MGAGKEETILSCYTLINTDTTRWFTHQGYAKTTLLVNHNSGYASQVNIDGYMTQDRLTQGRVTLRSGLVVQSGGKAILTISDSIRDLKIRAKNNTTDETGHVTIIAIGKRR